MGVNKKDIHIELTTGNQSFEAIVKKLNKQDRVSEEEVANYVLEILYADIHSLPKKITQDKLLNLYNYLKILNQCLEYISYNDTKTKKKLEKLEVYVDQQKNSPAFSQKVKEFFKNLKTSLVLIRIQNEEPKNNLDEGKDNENFKEYINYLLFDAKIYDYVEIVFNSDNLKLDTSPLFRRDLIKKIFNNYTESIRDNNYFDTVYYERIVNLILDYKNYLDDDIRINFLKELKSILKSGIVDERGQQFLASTINNLCNIKITDVKSAIQQLNKKYLPENNDKSEKINEVNHNDYIDMTDKNIITIDGSGTHTFDDALSFEVLPNGNFLIGVYIANVADFISKKSPLDISALNKGSSIYIPFNRVPMFPDYLSNIVFSLRENEERYAISHLFEFDKNTLEPVNFEITKSLIKVRHNYSYEEAEKCLMKKNDNEDYKLLKNLCLFSEHLNLDRQNIEKYHDVKNILKEINFEKDLITKDHNSSMVSNMNSEYIIYLNRFVAQLFNNSKYNLPFLYRINNSELAYGDVEELKSEIKNDVKVKGLAYKIKRILQPSFYSTNNTGHHGLKIEAYGHLGSPIRNYASLVTQRLEIEFLIKKNIADNVITEWGSDLEYIASVLNKRREINDLYAIEYNKLYKKYKKNDEFKKDYNAKTR